MIIISFFLMILSFNSIAAFPLIDIQNLSGFFNDQKGNASADFVKYSLPSIKITHKEIEIEFNKKERHLVLKDPNSTTVELGFDFSFLNVFRSFEFTRTTVKSVPKKFLMESDYLDVFIDKKKIKINKFRIETDISDIDSSESEKMSILDGFLKRSVLKLKKLRLKNSNKDFTNFLALENPQFLGKIKKAQRSLPMIIRFLNFEIFDGEFKGTALIDSYINLGARLSGNVYLSEDRTELRITLRRAKMGYFSIRRTLLRMVRKLKVPNITIEKNVIVVNLQRVSEDAYRAFERVEIQ